MFGTKNDEKKNELAITQRTLAEKEVELQQAKERSAELQGMLVEAASRLEGISQPPLQLATITGINEGSIDIALTNGVSWVVGYDPRLQDQLAVGRDVTVSPESMAVVGVEADIKTANVIHVKEMIDDGRVRVHVKGEERIIQTSIGKVTPGESVMVDASYSVIIGSLGNQTKAFQIDSAPKISWDSIGGLDDTIEKIRDAIELPYVHRELFAQFPNKQAAKGVLLYGPAGCGKTLLGKAVAYNLAQQRSKGGKPLNGHFLYAAGPEFLQKYVGTGEEKIRELFSNARETAAQNGDPVVIFIDEPETVFRARGTGKSTDATDPLVNQFLVEMDGLNDLSDVIVLLATNKQDALDPAVIRPGRIDKKIYVPRPDRNGAQSIFGIYLQDMPIHPKLVSEHPVYDMAAHASDEVFGDRPLAQIHYTSGERETVHYRHIFSGASAVSIVNRATDIAIKRAIAGGEVGLGKKDISEAVDHEYHENKALSSQLTKDDVQHIAGDRFETVYQVTSLTGGN